MDSMDYKHPIFCQKSGITSTWKSYVVYGILLSLFFNNIARPSPDKWENFGRSSLPLIENQKDTTISGNESINDWCDSTDQKFEPMPILSYDTDTGFGIGGKAFLLNYLHQDESIDMIIFLSTKGERWVRTVFSIPDFELRQGTVYPLALDFTIDYDKWISYNYFGLGNHSKSENKENYVRELLEISGYISRGFSELFVGQVGLKYNKIQSRNFSPDGQLRYLPARQNQAFIEYISLNLKFRYDSRDSYINPTNGIVFKTDLEWSPAQGSDNIHFHQWSLWFQNYTTIISPYIITATRIGIKNIWGDQLPIQLLLPIGGTSTLRGFPQDRFLDKTAGIMNIEFRFPLYRRLGGLLAGDFGEVWHSIEDISLRGWKSNLTLGLRFYMDTYVVRIDIGFSEESTGLYFNFGHIF
jgi:outer membrane protein assembly factor BamA